MKFSSLFLILLFFLQLGIAQNTQKELGNEKDLSAIIQSKLDSSVIYYEKGNYAASLKSNLEILELAKKSKNTAFITKAYRFLAYDFLILNDTILARENFENAKKYAELLDDDTTLGLSFMDLANYYSSADNDYKKAKEYHDASIVQFKKAKDTTSLVKAYFNAIISATADENYDDSKMYLEQIDKSHFDAYIKVSFNSSIKSFWADYYGNKQQYILAEKFAREAIALSDNTDFVLEKAEGHLQLSNSLHAQQKFEEAYKERLTYEALNDESVAMRQSGESQAALAKFQVEQYQNEILDQKEKSQLQQEIVDSKNKANNILILVCLIGLLSFISLFVAYKKRREIYKALKKKNIEYLEAKQKSEHLAKAKSKFFSTVSHELRTPLYGVIGLSTILLEDPKLKSHEKDLKSLKFSADYLLALINDVLQINKIDSKNLDAQESSFHVRDFIQSIASTFEYMRLQNKNKIEVKVDDSIPIYLKGNVVRLSQILMNLVGNACKFTENGIVEISLTANTLQEDEDRMITFEVKDNGIGIPKDKQENIFDEFTQVESLDYSYQGTGLGLPIVKKLLLASNATIALESELGKGTSFTFSLPFEVMKEEVEEHKKASVIDKSFLENKKILIAEDNRINQIVTKKILEKKGVHCTIAENGKEALELVKDHKYDIILMDLNMPVMDGFQATVAIRKFNTVIPIVALTAVEVEEVRNEIYFTGMDDIIVKPYDDTKFTRIIIDNISKPRVHKSNKKTG